MVMEKSEGGVVVSAELLHPVSGVVGSFSQLLFSEESENNQVELDDHSRNEGDGPGIGGGNGIFNFNNSAAFYHSDKPPKMLCFGDDYGCADLVFNNNDINNISSKSGGGVTCITHSSSTTSSTNNTNSLPKSNRKRNGCNDKNGPVVQSLSPGTGAPARIQRNYKKVKTSQNSTVGGHAKVKKERLGERVAALQQLVSPFGKTDTASVLHEAMGYIKFLQAQVEVLCSPYLQRTPSNSTKPPPLPGCEENGGGELKGKDLRSRGLCLVPVERTLHVAESNGADFWSPLTIKNGSSGR